MNLILKLVLVGRNLWPCSALHTRNPEPRCWDDVYNFDAKIFHLHIPKAAGCSVVSDLSSMVGRRNIYSYETCFHFSDSANFTALQDTVVMLRQPREHVFSQYRFCKLATDPGYRSIVRYLEAFPGEKNFHMTISFQNWIEEWTRSPRYGSYSILEDREFCWCPHNLQASRLACKNETHRSATVDLDAAKHETCFRFSDSANFTALQDTVVMIRQPREHVFSQYQFCYRSAVRYLRGLPGQKNFHLANSFQNWTDEWTRRPRYGYHSIYEDYEFCYCPHNLQASRLACKDDRRCSATVDLDAAKRSLDAVTMLGVTEAYHESLCLFHAHLMGELPNHCNCESPNWTSYKETRETHGESYEGSIEDMPPETIAQVDAMTQQDKAIYQRGVNHFVADVQKMEKRFGTKILCQDRLKMLGQKANY